MSTKQKGLEEQKIKIAVVLPAEFSFRIKEIEMDAFRKKERKLNITTIVAEALNLYFKSNGYKEVS